jgi:RHS repeat-associated protein
VYHTDGLGSVVAMTRGSGSGALVLRTYSYEAFGKVRVETEAPFAPANRYTYTGREALGDSLGLMYYRWRVMDPNVGRFTSEDPLGFVDGANRYRYVRNQPGKHTDPFGLLTAEDCWREYGEDVNNCKKLKSKCERAICYAAAMDKCALCLAAASAEAGARFCATHPWLCAALPIIIITPWPDPI